jgi:hypothetical protein
MSFDFDDFELELSTLSAHVKYGSREAAAEALLRLGVGHGAPVPVWPPRKLPHGVFISPVRSGWVSLWNPLETTRDWFPKLTATLECPGVVLEVIESVFWTADFFLGAEFLGRVELPTAAVEQELLRMAAGEPEASDGQPPRLGDGGAAESEEYREALRQLREERPAKEALRPFLPPHADLERAWEMLTAIDRHETESEAAEGEAPFAEDYLEQFATYLGIRDAAWDPQADADAFADGDYEDDDSLPDGWQEFVVLPVPQLRVL